MNNLTTNLPSASAVESALVMNDLRKLTIDQRLSYYRQVCDSVGLNHLTKPFCYIELNGKLTLYATKDATEQLRKIHGVSIEILSKEICGDYYDVHVRARDINGKNDEDIGSVFIAGLKAENLSNAKMKAVTKAKRRATLSICGLGMLDESELDGIDSSAIKITDNPQIENPFEKIETSSDAIEKEPELIIEEDPGDFVINLGKKYIGKKIKDVDVFELDGFVNYFYKQEKLGKAIDGKAKIFIEKAEKFLSLREFGKDESIVDDLDSALGIRK